MKTLVEEWDLFENEVIPATAGAVQRRDLKRAFYAGAHSMLVLLSVTGIDDISPEQGADMIQKLEHEIDAFYADVERGAA